jgi:hypothetical protein
LGRWWFSAVGTERKPPPRAGSGSPRGREHSGALYDRYGNQCSRSNPRISLCTCMVGAKQGSTKRRVAIDAFPAYLSRRNSSKPSYTVQPIALLAALRDIRNDDPEKKPAKPRSCGFSDGNPTHRASRITHHASRITHRGAWDGLEGLTRYIRITALRSVG